jgi:hypothetical protein
MGERDPSFRNYPGYDQDFAAWIDAQVAALRDRRFDALDLDHLIDEVEGVGKSEFRAFTSAIELILVHMLKWDYQPEKRSRSWRTTIHDQRRAAAKLIKQNPSFKSRIGEAIADAYEAVPSLVERETTIPAERLPAVSPYDWEQILHRLHDFDPDRPWPN